MDDATQDTGARETQLDRLRYLSDKLGCMLETDLMLLTKASAATVEAWRKRSTGPSYMLIGNRYFYHFDDVRQFMQDNLRRSKRPASAGMD